MPNETRFEELFIEIILHFILVVMYIWFFRCVLFFSASILTLMCFNFYMPLLSKWHLKDSISKRKLY